MHLFLKTVTTIKNNSRACGTSGYQRDYSEWQVKHFRSPERKWGSVLALRYVCHLCGCFSLCANKTQLWWSQVVGPVLSPPGCSFILFWRCSVDPRPPQHHASPTLRDGTVRWVGVGGILITPGWTSCAWLLPWAVPVSDVLVPFSASLSLFTGYSSYVCGFQQVFKIQVHLLPWLYVHFGLSGTELSSAVLCVGEVREQRWTPYFI